MDLDLKDKVVIITGATGGIGEAICREFLLEGATVVPFYRGNSSKLDPLREWAEQNQIPAAAISPAQVEISETAAVEKAVGEVVKQFGGVQVLINCAGIAHESNFLLMDDDKWEEVIQVNFNSLVKVSKAVVKHMFRARSGAIINISSILSFRFGRGVVAYASAKAAVDRFTEALAMEVGRKGIRVNAVCPGIIETKMTSGLMFFKGEDLLRQTSLERIGKPEDVAKAVVFLASEKSASFITGHKLVIDGGLSI